jgi:alkaline phosphatase D
MPAGYHFRGRPMESFNMDQWDGCGAARNRLTSFFDRSNVSNPVTLTGDIHSACVRDLKTDFADETSKTVGTEFVGTLITWEFPGEYLPPVEAALADNPHTKCLDGSYRGRVRCDVDRQGWTTNSKGVPTEPGNGSLSPTRAPATI